MYFQNRFEGACLQQMKIWYGKHLGYLFGVFLVYMMGSSKSETLCKFHLG